MNALEKLGYKWNKDWNGNPRFRMYYNDKYIIEIFAKLNTFDKYNHDGKTVRASSAEKLAVSEVIKEMENTK